MEIPNKNKYFSKCDHCSELADFNGNCVVPVVGMFGIIFGCCVCFVWMNKFVTKTLFFCILVSFPLFCCTKDCRKSSFFLYSYPTKVLGKFGLLNNENCLTITYFAFLIGIFCVLWEIYDF